MGDNCFKQIMGWEERDPGVEVGTLNTSSCRIISRRS